LTVLAAVGIAIFALTRGGGGETNATTAFTGSDFHSMVVDPQNPKRIFAGGHQAVSVSQNGGKSWRQISSLKDRDAMGWGFDGSMVYEAATPASASRPTREDIQPAKRSTALHRRPRLRGWQRDPLRSIATGRLLRVDRCRQELDGDQPTRGRSFFGRILVDPNDPKHVVAADAAAGVLESHDDGRAFKDIGGVRSPTWVNWDPNNPQTIAASSRGGAARSDDGGKTWRQLGSPPSATILEVDPSNPS
jgi:hypothetical protein